VLNRVLRVASIAALTLFMPSVASAETDAYTAPGTYDWVVPAGVTSAAFTVVGARGGNSASSSGGEGGSVVATLALTPGETLKITVGGAGADTPAITGGFNGGGLAGSQTCVIPPSTKYCNGAGGGGASDVRRGGTAMTNRVLVAGGGGGAGGRSADGCLGEGCVPATARGGGDGGGGGNPAFNGSIGQNGGADVEIPGSGGCGGGGATSVAGGTAGGTVSGEICTGPSGNTSGGSAGIGGHGGDAAGGGSGGGGGGGFFGGGGGSGASAIGPRGGGGGGGGGSNFVTPSATGVTSAAGGGDGDGIVTVAYDSKPTPPRISLSGSKSQKLGKSIVVDAKAVSEETTFTATGKVKLKGPDPVLGPVTAAAAKSEKVSLELDLSRKARKAIGKAIDKGKKPEAVITVTGRDGDGEESKQSRTIKLHG